MVIVDSPAETERELTPLHLCRDANPSPTGLETASEMAPGAKTRMLDDWASRGKNHLIWQVGLSFGSVAPGDPLGASTPTSPNTTGACGVGLCIMLSSCS